MIRRHQNLFNIANCAADALLLAAAYFIGAWLRMSVFTDEPQYIDIIFKPHTLLAAALYAVGMVAVYGLVGMYGSFRYENPWQEAMWLCGANAVGLLGVGAMLYFFRLEDFSRLALAYFYILSCVFVIAKRLLVRRILARYRALGYSRRTALLVGGGALAERYYREVVAQPRYGYAFAGYYADAPSPDLPAYRGGIEQTREAIASGKVDEVVIALDTADAQLIGTLVAACGRFGVKISVIPPYNDFIPSTPRMELAGGLKLMNVRSAPDKGPIWRFVKRTMDIVGAALGLILTSPVLLGAAIAVKLTSPGPAIFRQERAGKNGRLFTMLKFRSMTVDAEERLAELQSLNEADGLAFKIAHDPRITPVGRFLRKTSIDELPQLFNILKGDMSLVGPRPPLMREVERYSDWEWGRLTVKPGLTCFWQISGRSDIRFSEWMQLDLRYVEEQGLWTDIKILWKTVGVVLKGKGAY